MKPTSLRLRLVLVWAVFITVILGIAGLGLRFLFERSITERTRTELDADLRQLERGMDVASNGTVSILREPTDPQFDIVFGGRYWQIAEGSKILVRSRSLRDAEIRLPEVPSIPPNGLTLRIEGPKKQQLFATVRPYILRSPSGSQRTLVITTAVDRSEIEEDTAKFTADLYMGLLLLALLLLAGAYAHVTVGLGPLQDLRAKVAAVRDGTKTSLDGRFPDEVMPLVEEANALLEAQRRQLKLARERAGDLAHGLKTPLAVMAAKSRQLRRIGATAVADDIERQIEFMRRHVERELARVRARGAGAQGQLAADVGRLARALVAAVESLPRTPPLEISLTAPASLSRKIDGDDFNNLLGNLLENAHKYAGTKAVVKLGDSGEHGLALEVEDDGPGIADDQFARVLLRGERAGTTVPGTGLGLAIVSDLVSLYGGKIDLARSDLGGLKVKVELPL